MKRYSGRVIAEGISKMEFIECTNGEWVKYDDVYNEIGEKCDCCGRYGHDRRTLLMGCGYEMSELGIPFEKRKYESLPGFNQDELFTLRVCKDCRGKWMDAIKDWFTGDDDD